MRQSREADGLSRSSVGPALALTHPDVVHRSFQARPAPVGFQPQTTWASSLGLTCVRLLARCLYSFESPDALSQGLAAFCIAAQDAALEKGTSFKIAISGGSLPKVLGQDLIGREGVKWDQWCVIASLGGPPPAPAPAGAD